MEFGCVVCFALLVVLVISRGIMMKKLGIQAFVFGKTNPSDFLLPPIVFFFIYHLFANVFDLPRVSTPELFHIPLLQYMGLVSCMSGACIFLWGIVSFGTSFRVGIDEEQPDDLVTTGAFRFSRNPLYVAFALELLGFFLVLQNLMFLIALIGGCCLFHRQILREEKFLREYYGEEYEAYCRKVRRYL